MEWIKCSERMPEPGTLVIIMQVGFHVPYVGWWNPPGSDGWEIRDKYNEPEDVTHWMPLPDLPPHEKIDRWPYQVWK